MERERSGIVELWSEEVGDLIWARFSEPGITIPQTQPIMAEIQGLRCSDSLVAQREKRILKANWKVIANGGLESYHYKIAHRPSIAPLFKDNTST